MQTFGGILMIAVSLVFLGIILDAVRQSKNLH